MSEATAVTAALLLLLVVLPAAAGLLLDRLRVARSELLVHADHDRARTTLAYYNDVHDSHSG